jgi:hypothetical protein
MTNKELQIDIMDLKLKMQALTIKLDHLTDKINGDVVPHVAAWSDFRTKWKFGLAMIVSVSGVAWFLMQEIIKLAIKKFGG